MHVGVAQCVKGMDARVTMNGLVILDALFMHGGASRTSREGDK